MNLTTTVRHAIAISEALLRQVFSRDYFSDFSIELEPTAQFKRGVGVWRDMYHRSFEVNLVKQGEVLAYLEITLVRSFVGGGDVWLATVDFTDAYSVCGSQTYSGRLEDGQWQLRPTHRIALSQHEGNMLRWDPYHLT